MITKALVAIGLTMMVVDDIEAPQHTIIRKGELVTAEQWDEWQLWLRPQTTHWGLGPWNGEFSVDWWDEDVLRKLKPI